MENLARQEKQYSYQDLLEIDDENHYEIIDGELYLMSSPRPIHQLVSGEIYRQLATYLLGKKCKAFISPLDVCFTKERDFSKIYNVVQPDVMVICNTENIGDTRIIGAPELIVEILSPNNKSHDRLLKFNLYQKYGVKEYWIVDIEEQTISPFRLNEQGVYTLARVYHLEESIPVEQLESCTIDLKQFLEDNKQLLKKEGKENG